MNRRRFFSKLAGLATIGALPVPTQTTETFSGEFFLKGATTGFGVGDGNDDTFHDMWANANSLLTVHRGDSLEVIGTESDDGFYIVREP